MNMKFIVLTAAGASLGAWLAGCTTQPVAPAPATGIVIGTTTDTTRIFIKSVDQGPTVYIAPGALGYKFSVSPGHHTMHVICDVQGSWVSKDVPIDVQPGQTYKLVGSTVEGPAKCDVAVSGNG
jgi:hypothetical protein